MSARFPAWVPMLAVVALVALADPCRAGNLSGHALDASSQPVADAQVTVLEAGRSTLTDESGRYTFTNLPGGRYRVALQRLGFAPQVLPVVVGDGDAILDFRLRVSLVEIAPVQVTASASATTPLTSPQPVSVLDEEALRTARGETLGETVQKLAGVRSWSTGGGIGKPVIRGLRSDRVLVLADGARLETQGWGDEHGPNVDTEAVERIEIIRGPASVLYGSDALGGVVNLVPRNLPTAFGRAPFVRGRLAGGFASNGKAPTGHAGFEGASGGLGFRGAFTGRRAGDRDTPGGRLANSGSEAMSWSGELGARGGWGSLQGTAGATSEDVEIHEDPAEEPGATPWQAITDRTARLKGMFPTGAGGHLDLVATWERNERREFEARNDVDYVLGLKARTLSGDARYHHTPVGRLHGVIGAAWLGQRFDKSGEESLIPESTSDNLAAYAFEQVEGERLHGSFGLRFDHRRLTVEDDADLGVAAQERTWSAVSGNVGALLRLGGSAALALNVGRGFRAPSTFDLFSNGVHEGTVAYEVGDPTLGTETSLNTDLSFRVQSGRLTAEVTAYLNRIDGFIYSRPTGTIDSASGFQVFQVTQGDARLAGAELAAQWHPSGGLHLHVAADHVRGDNTSTDTPLPWIPPFRALWGVRFEGRARGAIESPYVDVTAESNAAQDRLDPFDVGTGAYTLVHVAAGLAFANDGKPVRLDVGARNLLDTAYRDFMSRTKAWADAPGRNVWVRVTSAF